MADLADLGQQCQQLPSELTHADVLIKGLPGFRTGRRQLPKEGILKGIHSLLSLRALCQFPRFMRRRGAFLFIASTLDIVNRWQCQGHAAWSFWFSEDVYLQAEEVALSKDDSFAAYKEEKREFWKR